MAKWKKERGFFVGNLMTPVEKRVVMESSDGRIYTLVEEIRLPNEPEIGRYASRPVTYARITCRVGEGEVARLVMDLPAWMKREVAYRNRLRNLKAVHKAASAFSPSMGEALAAAMSK